MMYTVKDFIENKIAIAMYNETQYNKTMKWLRRYNMMHDGAYIDRFEYCVLKNYVLYFGKDCSAIDLTNKHNGVLDVCGLGGSWISRNGYTIITIDDIDFDCNKVGDYKIPTLSEPKNQWDWVVW